ncbi:hypothetical protein RRSWK_06174 [Rhodopirellula sp. SWK7]|nr:hypothetical protein RRSWK_06174 [Rhodopirellula sp. SWK7]
MREYPIIGLKIGCFKSSRTVANGIDKSPKRFLDDCVGILNQMLSLNFEIRFGL